MNHPSYQTHMDAQDRNKKPLHDFKKINGLVYFYKPASNTEITSSSTSTSTSTLSPSSQSGSSSIHASPSKSGSVASDGSLSLTDGVTKRKTSSSSSSSGHGKDPSLIIYCAWASALPRHVTKYTDAYKKRFPASAMLLVLTPAWAMVLPRTWHAQLLRPAAVLIKASMTEQERARKMQLPDKVNGDGSDGFDDLLTGSDKSNGMSDDKVTARTNDMLLHLVSNGGMMAANALATSLGHSFPISAVIFDCGPGTTTVHSSANGIFATLPIRWQKFFRGSLIRRFAGRLAWSTLYCIFAVLYTLRLLFRRGNVAAVARTKLNDGTVVPRSARRCYLYCVEDDLVAWRDVESHADDAERKGCGGGGDGVNSSSNGEVKEIERVKFGPGAKHAALSLFDGEKYWRAVERTWRVTYYRKID